MSLSRFFSRPFFVAGIAWIVILGLGFFLVDDWVMPAIAGQFKKTSPVPELVGLQPEKAQTQLASLGLHYMLDSTGDYSENIPAGHILTQFPPAGTVVKQGRRVWVKVSKGFKAVEVPALRGLSVRQAEISLQQAGLKMGRVAEIAHAAIPAGAVIGTQPPAGAKVENGREIAVNVSRGGQGIPSSMPSLKGLSLSQAQGKIQALGLKVGKVTARADSRSLPKTVLDQSVSAGTQLKGQTVDLTVSK
jgi:eukaryotic-like serine/threonine-protein kinase